MFKSSKKSVIISLSILFFAAFLSSCENEKYPKYRLTTIFYIPDSLKSEHRKFITETVRAASQHMTGGDYENVDETIKQVEKTADDVFCVKVIGLEKTIDENYWTALKLKPDELTDYEKRVLDSLVNLR